MEVGEVYILCSTNGAVRGNHYHSENTEYFYVIKGAAKAAFSDTNSGMYMEFKVSESDNMVIMVPLQIIHAFKNAYDEGLIMLAIASKEYDPLNADTYKFELLT